MFVSRYTIKIKLRKVFVNLISFRINSNVKKDEEYVEI